MAEARGSGVLDRVLDVLGCFSEDEPSLRVAEIAERTGIAVSSLHRLLASLVAHGLVVRVPGHRYAVGARLWELGELSPLSLRLRERATPYLVRLYEATGENVHLAVLDGAGPESATVLYVGRVTGRRSIETISRAGGRGPLHATGVGKALLATRDEEWLRSFFGRPLEQETVHTVTGERALRREIARTRATGYARTREEMTLGNISIAVSLPHTPGLPPIALGLVVHLARADSAEAEARLSAMLAQTAKEIHAAIRE